MIHALTACVLGWRAPGRKLLAAGPGITIQPVSPDDVAALWELLAPGPNDHLRSAYTAFGARAAGQHLEETIYQLQERDGTVRGAFICAARASQAQQYPAFPVGLLKLYSELPRAARLHRYASVQRWQRDAQGWLWLALLLAEPNPQRAVIVPPV